MSCLLAVACANGAAPYVPANISPPVPEREFRGVWIATVKNIDWPSKPGLTTEQQKQELLALLDRCQQLRLNVVILQVRPACDALYPSKLEPWSEYISGLQGRPPNPFWDPLDFAVREAHARGLELHAWFNPFRARHLSGFSPLAPEHVSKTHPAWVKTYAKQLWLDPALPEVHDFSARVILDVVNRYDIDGIHIDDYFYPYPEKDAERKDLPFPDWTSWNRYLESGGKLGKDDWRRDNVNRFIARVYRDVKAAKPWVRVGISPFGIYRPGFPAQIRGFDQYQSLYADPQKWLAQGWVDYLAPQLYWRIDPPAQSFPVLLKWWAENNPRRKTIVAGLNTTAVGSGANPWPASEIARQIELARGQNGASGHIHWNMSALMKNRGGVADTLKQRAYQSLALAPSLNGGPSPAAAPKVTVTSRGAGMTIRGEATGSAANVRFWLVQEQDGARLWRTTLQPAGSFQRNLETAPEIISVRALDKFGNLGPPTVLTRSSAATK